MPLRYLFIDMNAFFASVEQQDDPSLRHRPVAVIPTDAETTACIAASYEAKAWGVKTGTPVWEARKLCPKIVFKIANHRRYVIMHNRIVEAVGSVLPVDRILSIDEMTCRLLTHEERRPEQVLATGLRIKEAIRKQAGDYLTCSIGAAPNNLLAKMAADLKKPDGLTVLADADVPEALHGLKLQDFPGIGPRMERRLNLYGVFTVRQLCQMSAPALSEVWGSRILGNRWYRLLRGEDVPDPVTRRQTVSHSHVLPPPLRTDAGAYGVLVRLTHKAAARLRKINYWAGSVSVHVGFRDWDPKPKSGWNRGSGWELGCRIPHCQDTPNILRAVNQLWEQRPRKWLPFQVGVVLANLQAARTATPSLFDDDRSAAILSHTMDEVNAEFGANVVHFGTMHGYESTAPTRIAFTQIPDFDRRVI